MKKYLFLVGLFVVYLILSFNNKSVPVLSYQNKYDDGVSTVNIIFNEGINSKSISDLFDGYKSEYYVEQIKLNSEDVSVSCTNINDCLNKIYDEHSERFNVLYMPNGFSVKEISLLAYTDEIISFLDKNNLVYTIK